MKFAKKYAQRLQEQSKVKKAKLQNLKRSYHRVKEKVFFHFVSVQVKVLPSEKAINCFSFPFFADWKGEKAG